MPQDRTGQDRRGVRREKGILEISVLKGERSGVLEGKREKFFFLSNVNAVHVEKVDRLRILDMTDLQVGWSE